MTDSVLDVIQRHASVRHYRPDPLPPALVETIVAAGQRASTSSNMQAYSVVAVTDATKRQRLAELCGNQKHVAEAPLFLAWCADLARLERICQRRGYRQVSEYLENFLVAAVDAVIAAQNAALAAESLGLGICYIGSIRNRSAEVIALLGLPKLVFPITGMTVGWPATTPRVKPRLPLRAVLHWEQYDTRHEEEDLQAYDRVMIESGIYRGRQIPAAGREVVEEDYGWSEHIARRVAQVARTDLRRIVQEQGFELK